MQEENRTFETLINQHTAIKPSSSGRYTFMWLLHTGLVMVYAMRVNLSVAVVVMTHDLGWSEHEKSIVLSSFFAGYALGNLMVAFIIRKLGPTICFGVVS